MPVPVPDAVTPLRNAPVVAVVHAQPAVVLTAKLPEPEAAVTEALVGENAYEHAAADGWLSESVLPPTVIDAVRVLPVLLLAAV